jgi:hypothetical protein
MEAGIEPASPVQTHVQPFQILTSTTTVLDNIKNNGNQLLELCEQCTNLCEIAQHTHARSEQILVNTLFKTILSHIQIIQSTLTTYTKTIVSTDTTNKSLIIYGLEIEKYLQQYVSLLWDKLKFPYSQLNRTTLLDILIILQETSYLFKLFHSRSSTLTNYSKPTKTSKPSYISQVINPSPSSSVIDPILASLQQNYYYPLAAEMSAEEMDYDNNDVNQSNPQPPKSPIKKVENSIVPSLTFSKKWKEMILQSNQSLLPQKLLLNNKQVRLKHPSASTDFLSTGEFILTQATQRTHNLIYLNHLANVSKKLIHKLKFCRSEMTVKFTP